MRIVILEKLEIEVKPMEEALGIITNRHLDKRLQTDAISTVHYALRHSRMCIPCYI